MVLREGMHLILASLLALPPGSALASDPGSQKALPNGVRAGETEEDATPEAEPRETLQPEPRRYPVAPGLTVGGSFRARVETRDDFGFDATGAIDDEDYLLSQLRLNVEWEPTR